ncbi:hypothetical protein ABKN59_008682 [Abortiporus biennis]
MPCRFIVEYANECTLLTRSSGAEHSSYRTKGCISPCSNLTYDLRSRILDFLSLLTLQSNATVLSLQSIDMSSDSSTAVDSSNLQSPEIQIHIIDYLHLSGIVILYYDYLLTFQDEVRYMWFQPLSSTWLFFLNRYFSIFADIALTIGTFATYTSIEEGMRWYSTASFVITLIGQIIASIILLLRTWALYNRSWNIIISTTSFATGLAVLVIWSTSNESSDNRTISDGCINTPPNASRPRMFMHNDYGVGLLMNFPLTQGIAGAWEAHIVYDLMIFATVVFKTYRDREQFREAKLSRFGSLLDLILRDGAIYFAVMACANIANTVTFYVGIPGRLSRLASSISVTLVSRMMLNLRKQATPDFTDQLDDPNMSSIEFEGRTNIHNATVEISQSTSPSREVLQFSFSGSNEQTPSSGNISCEIHEGTWRLVDVNQQLLREVHHDDA